jgi:hypothetical protein
MTAGRRAQEGPQGALALHGWTIDRRGAALALLALALGGCSGLGGAEPPPPDPNIFPSRYKADVAAFLRTYLNNPRGVRDAYISEPVLKPIAGASRYVSCVRYNARDTKNQYQGNEENMAIFWAGGLNQFLSPQPGICVGAVYQRFPEAEVLVP